MQVYYGNFHMIASKIPPDPSNLQNLLGQLGSYAGVAPNKRNHMINYLEDGPKSKHHSKKYNTTPIISGP